MLQLAHIKEDKDRMARGLMKRGIQNAAELLDEILDTDQKRRSTQAQLDDTLAKSNSLAKQIGQLMREGKKDEAEQIKAQTAELKQSGKDLQEQLNQFEQDLQSKLYNIPNVPHESVPAGNSDEDNETIEEKGEVPQLGDEALPHWELIKKYDIIDFDLGNKITGAGFPVYKGKGARLQRALVNFFLDQAVEQGYREIQPPIVVNEASGYGTGQLPDKEGQMYHMPTDNLYLIPTAEVPITNMYRDVIVKPEELPIKLAGFTPCFRREAGSWGADVRGLNRLHQFDKVEIVQINHPDESYKTLEQMSNYIKGLLEKLGLPYRVLNLCGGDLGVAAAKTLDMEVYSAGQGRWLEVSSVSNFEAYQANRLKLRFKGEDKKSRLLHTLNGSALALPRILAAILENNQSAGGIKIPEVLVPYTGFDTIS